MKTRTIPLAILIGFSVFLSGCSMKVSGFVTDAVTDEPVTTAGVTIGKRYVHVDMAGHYEIKTRRYTEDKVEVIAKGYEKTAVPIDSSKSRYPQVNVALTPARRAPAAPTVTNPPYEGPGARTAP
jgi:hypothetical protein